MSKLKKLVQKFLRDSPEISYDDVNTLLKAFGFEEIRSKGSHHIFRNSQSDKITVPKKGGKMVKNIYIKQIIELLKLEEWNNEN